MTTGQRFNSDQAIKIINQLYEGINKFDADLFLKTLATEIVRFEFEGSPNSGTFRGLDEMRKNLVDGRSTWAEGSCTPIEFIPEGEKILAVVHVKVRRKNEANWIDGKVIDGFSVKNGLITEFSSFENLEKALAWARKS